MRSGPRSSWSVRERDNGPFLNALYVREAFGPCSGARYPGDGAGRPPGTTRSDSLLVTKLVAALDKSLGRQAPFSYFVDVLPVTGNGHLDLSPISLLVGMDAYLDNDRLTALLEERLTPLV